MNLGVILAVLMPLFGTVLGAGGVCFLRTSPGKLWQAGLQGFAGGVMVAASVWSLLIPAMEQSAGLGRFAFLPAVAGVWLGVLFLGLLDRVLTESSRARLGSNTMLVLAVALHNLPEGMAVGAVLAGWLSGLEGISLAAVLALSGGIALQNLPEGAIISMPLCAQGMGKGKSFYYGAISGVVEPMGAVATVLLAELAVPALPLCLSFSAGAMLYVVAQELLPALEEGKCRRVGTLLFCAGFTVMMAMDVALG